MKKLLVLSLSVLILASCSSSSDGVDYNKGGVSAGEWDEITESWVQDDFMLFGLSFADATTPVSACQIWASEAKITGVDSVYLSIVTRNLAKAYLNSNANVKATIGDNAYRFDLGLISFNKAAAANKTSKLFDISYSSYTSGKVTFSDVNFVSGTATENFDNGYIYIKTNKTYLSANDLAQKAATELEVKVYAVDGSEVPSTVSAGTGTQFKITAGGRTITIDATATAEIPSNAVALIRIQGEYSYNQNDFVQRIIVSNVGAAFRTHVFETVIPAADIKQNYTNKIKIVAKELYTADYDPAYVASAEDIMIKDYGFTIDVLDRFYEDNYFELFTAGSLTALFSPDINTCPANFNRGAQFTLRDVHITHSPDPKLDENSFSVFRSDIFFNVKSYK